MTRPRAAERLRRVLALVPYIAAREEVSIAELAGTFGISEAEIEDDLAILPYCGLPPYTPDRLIDVAIVGGHVSLRFAEYFSRPLRLTPAEGFALLAAGRGLLAVPGSEPSGPLGRALAKLETALGAEDVVGVVVGEPPHVEELRAAAEARQRIEIDYYSFGRDEASTRLVDPYSVANLRGQWYLAAYCHRAGDDRLFRVDRIRDLRQTDEHFEGPSTQMTPEDVFHAGPEHTRVTLDLPESARWVVESYPVEGVEERPRGRFRVTLVVAARPWLERVLLTLGPTARVVAPRSWRAAGAEAAARVLARYGG